VNFVDLDFAMIGPIVRDVSASFDKYWNAATVVPIELLEDSSNISAAMLKRARTRLATHALAARHSRYAEALRADDGVKRLLAGDWPLHWASNYRFVSDDPRKVVLPQRDPARAQVAAVVFPVVGGAQRGAALISPYFVPGAATPKLAALARRGRTVRVLTNSLASNDVTAVHGGYARYRQPLLAAGVQLWELKRRGRQTNSSLFGSSGASLHTKAFSVDDRIAFVGSYNLDARSTWLNCEQGVLVEHANVAQQIALIFASHTTSDSAWRVSLHDSALRWSAGDESFDVEPHASWARRGLAWLTGLLPLEAQL
jgi:putative cardiolipin synthase